MNKAIFFDRDGVINLETGYITRLADFHILPDVIEFLSYVQSKNYLLFIISNQGGISKGLFTMNEIDKMHSYLMDELSKKKIFLTEIYYCPHHPDSGSGKCLCRKPDSLMLEKAIARFNIDPSKSYFIGDRETDIQAATKVKVTGIQVKTNSSLKALESFFT